MFRKQPKTPVHKSASKKNAGKSGDKASDSSPEPVAVDRAGFDLGGSTGKTSAGTGLGLGPSWAENRRDRRLPRRKGKPT